MQKHKHKVTKAGVGQHKRKQKQMRNNATQKITNSPLIAWARGQLETKVVQAGPRVAKASGRNDMVAKLGIEPKDSRMLRGRDAARPSSG